MYSVSPAFKRTLTPQPRHKRPCPWCFHGARLSNCHSACSTIGFMKFLRMRPGHGEQLIAEGDVDVAEEQRRLMEEFRRQLDHGMWAAVPLVTENGRREASMVRAFEDVPATADRVIFFPRAAGGAA